MGLFWLGRNNERMIAAMFDYSELYMVEHADWKHTLVTLIQSV